MEIGKKSFIYVPDTFTASPFELDDIESQLVANDITYYKSILKTKEAFKSNLIPIELVNQVYAHELGIEDWSSKTKNFYNNRIRNLTKEELLESVNAKVNGIALRGRQNCLKLKSMNAATALKAHEAKKAALEKVSAQKKQGSLIGNEIRRGHLKLPKENNILRVLSTKDAMYSLLFAPAHYKSDRYYDIKAIEVPEFSEKINISIETLNPDSYVSNQDEFMTLLAMFTLSHEYFVLSRNMLNHKLIENRVPIRISDIAKARGARESTVIKQINRLMRTDYFITGAEETTLHGIKIGNHIQKKYEFIQDCRPYLNDTLERTMHLTREEQLKEAKVILVEWSSFMYDALLNDEKFFAYPKHLIEANTDVFQLYMSIRNSYLTHLEEGHWENLSWDEFSNKLNVGRTYQDFLKHLGTGLNKPRMRHSSDVKFLQDKGVTYIELWGYKLAFFEEDHEQNVAEILKGSFNEDQAKSVRHTKNTKGKNVQVLFSIEQEKFLSCCKTHLAPTVNNPIATDVGKLVNTMPDSLVREISKHLKISRSSHFTTEICVNKRTFWITAYDTDESLKNFARDLEVELSDTVTLPTSVLNMYLVQHRAKKKLLQSNNHSINPKQLREVLVWFVQAGGYPLHYFTQEGAMSKLLAYLFRRTRTLELILKHVIYGNEMNNEDSVQLFSDLQTFINEEWTNK